MSRQPYGMTTPEQRDQAADDGDEAAWRRDRISTARDREAAPLLLRVVLRHLDEALADAGRDRLAATRDRHAAAADRRHAAQDRFTKAQHRGQAAIERAQQAPAPPPAGHQR